MISNIASMDFATNNKMKQQELLNAENLLKKNTGDNGTIDYSNKNQDEIEKINDAAIVVLSSKMQEEEGQSSFSINIDTSNQLYNEKGLSSDVTDSALFRSAETKYASNLNAGIAADTMNANEEVLSNLEQSIEEQALKAREENAEKLKEEQAQLEAQRVANNTNNIEQTNTNSSTANTEVNPQASAQQASSNTDVKSQESSQKNPTPESVDTYV